MAWFFAGEGYINISIPNAEKPFYPSLRVAIATTEKLWADLYHARFGGFKWTQNPLKSSNSGTNIHFPQIVPKRFDLLVRKNLALPQLLPNYPKASLQTLPLSQLTNSKRLQNSTEHWSDFLTLQN